MWEQIQANKRRSVVLITGMLLALAAVGYTSGELLGGAGAGPIGLLVALAIWGGMLLLSFAAGESIILQSAGARPLTADDSPQLLNVVEEMRLAAGYPVTPRVYIIDDPAPNAFAVGRQPGSSAIAVTAGLLHRLNRDELQGVIAHEMAHLRNADTRFMTLATVTLGTIVVLSELVRRYLWLGGRSSRRSDARGGGQAQAVLLLVGLVFAILGPLLAQLLYFACSRKREYLADACAAQFTRYPEGLASALTKIAMSRPGTAFASRATAPLFIVNPLAAEGAGGSLFATHPPTADRIRILRAMAGAGLADYEAAYRQAGAGGSLIGQRSLAGAPAASIRPAAPDEPLATRGAAQDAAHRARGYLQLRCGCGLEVQVPEGYERDEIRCLRCASVLPIPAAMPAAPPVLAAAAETRPAAASQLEYTRTTDGWESFRCECGRTIQLSPAFRAPQVRCQACGSTILVR